MPIKPLHDSRRSFLKQLAGGIALLPVAAPLAGSAAGAPPRLQRDVSWDAVRAQFPFRESMVPMNAGNLCPSPGRVTQRLTTLTREIEVDVSHGHRDGFHDLLEASRTKVADHLHADPDEVALVRNTTEANAAIIAGLPLAAGDEVVLWDQNHPTNNVAWDVQAARADLRVTRVSTPPQVQSREQLVDVFAEAIGPRTRVLAITHVSNTSGLLLPIKAICEMARRRDVFVHVDGAQSWGALRIDLRDLGCDSFSASCHKWLCGPKEAGVLYLRREHIERVWAHTVGFGWGTRVDPVPAGARKFEALGQRDDARLAVVADAIDFHRDLGGARIELRVAELAQALKRGLREAGVPVVTPDDATLSAGVVLVEVPEARRRDVVTALERDHGIAGSRAGGLRLCPHVYNTMEHVERAVEGVRALGDRLA
ncbi:MAG: aminotransferase class V-fold PLP-dependent enzyme [Gemmatimonadales bacterium]